MKYILIVFILTVLSFTNTYAQMNFQDSSAQVISFYNLGEKFEYGVIYQKSSYTENDTTSNEIMTYDVEVSVIDSTENNYVVKWFYKNFATNSTNPIVQKIAKASEDIAVNIKISSLGVIEEIVNWEEVRDYMLRAFSNIKKDLPKSDEVDKLMKTIETTYSSKAAIEATAIQDVQQLHNFHGGKYMLKDKIKAQLKTANVYYPGKPFDTDVTVELEELDKENNEYRIRSIHEINSDQLTQTTYDYLSKLLSKTQKDFPKREDFDDVTNTTEIVSVIHNQGWVLESVSWKEVTTQGITNMEKRSIVMK